MMDPESRDAHMTLDGTPIDKKNLVAIFRRIITDNYSGRSL